MAGILEYSTTAASNTAINSIGIQGSNAISYIDNAVRQAMADLASAITRHVTKAAGTYAPAKTDHNQLWRATGAVTLNLTAAATLTDGWALWVKADGGTITVDPNGAETINGAATLTVADGASAFIVCTGTTFYAISIGNGDVTLTGSQTLTNTPLTAPIITAPTFSTSVALTGELTPAQITSDQTDYAPTGHATVYRFRLDADASRTINSLAGGASGRKIVLQNISATFAITLLHDDGATGTAAMRFYCPRGVNFVLPAFCQTALQYDDTQSRWIVESHVPIASTSEMESASTTTAVVVPARQHRHPGHPKAWAYVTVSGAVPTLETSYNITSITDTATGRLTITIATDFSSVNWASAGGVDAATGTEHFLLFASKAAGSVIMEAERNGGALSDPDAWNFIGMGDQ